MEINRKDIITLNGYPDLIKDSVAGILLEKYFTHFSYLSHVHVHQELEKHKTLEQVLREYAETKDAVFIKSALGYFFIPESFKVFFISVEGIPNREKWLKEYGTDCMDTNNYTYVVDLDKKQSADEIAERITVEYGLWSLGRK